MLKTDLLSLQTLCRHRLDLLWLLDRGGMLKIKKGEKACTTKTSKVFIKYI